MGRPRSEPGQISTRERILEAALKLFTARGFAKTSIREVAEDLGLTESAVYRHFAGKDEILETILVQFEDKVYQPLAAPPGNSEEYGIVGSVLMGLPRLLLTDPQLLQISQLLLGELHHNERIRRFVKDAFVSKANLHLEELFQMLLNSGLPSVQTKTLTVLVNSLRLGWVYSTFVLENPTLDDLPALELELSDIARFLDEAISKGSTK